MGFSRRSAVGLNYGGETGSPCRRNRGFKQARLLQISTYSLRSHGDS
jgi:hypothetical protein